MQILPCSPPAYQGGCKLRPVIPLVIFPMVKNHVHLEALRTCHCSRGKERICTMHEGCEHHSWDERWSLIKETKDHLASWWGANTQPALGVLCRTSGFMDHSKDDHPQPVSTPLAHGKVTRTGSVPAEALPYQNKSPSEPLLPAWMPGPVLYGSAIDTTCIFWEKKCDRKAACRYYDNNLFRQR